MAFLFQLVNELVNEGRSQRTLEELSSDNIHRLEALFMQVIVTNDMIKAELKNEVEPMLAKLPALPPDSQG